MGKASEVFSLVLEMAGGSWCSASDSVNFPAKAEIFQVLLQCWSHSLLLSFYGRSCLWCIGVQLLAAISGACCRSAVSICGKWTSEQMFALQPNWFWKIMLISSLNNKPIKLSWLTSVPNSSFQCARAICPSREDKVSLVQNTWVGMTLT